MYELRENAFKVITHNIRTCILLKSCNIKVYNNDTDGTLANSLSKCLIYRTVVTRETNNSAQCKINNTKQTHCMCTLYINRVNTSTCLTNAEKVMSNVMNSKGQTREIDDSETSTITIYSTISKDIVNPVNNIAPNLYQ